MFGLRGLGKVEDYIRKMEDWTTWGDEICLKFIPDIIKRPDSRSGALI